jgi:hypothetical protein
MLMRLLLQLAAKPAKAVQVNTIAKVAQVAKAMLVVKAAKVVLVRITNSYFSRGRFTTSFLYSQLGLSVESYRLNLPFTNLGILYI